MANVIVINPFEVESGNEEQAVASWDRFASYFSAQPGHVSAKLDRAVDPDSRFHLVTVAEWESVEAFSAALNRPELQEIAQSSGGHLRGSPGRYEVIRKSA